MRSVTADNSVFAHEAPGRFQICESDSHWSPQSAKLTTAEPTRTRTTAHGNRKRRRETGTAQDAFRTRQLKSGGPRGDRGENAQGLRSGEAEQVRVPSGTRTAVV